MTELAATPIAGVASATVSQVLGWAADQDPALGDCDGETQPGPIAEFLEESERLSARLGWDFAVVAAHASAHTNGFTSAAWRQSYNPLPVELTPRTANPPTGFAHPREAAAVHVTYLTRLAGADPEVARDLEEVGFSALVPAETARAQGDGASARTLADLATTAVGADALQVHLAGIQRESGPDPGEGARAAGLPPLPEIRLVESDAYFEGRAGIGPVAICYHMTWDLNLERVLRLFQDRRNNKSANFVIARDGMVYQLVHSRHTAWTNGDYKDRHGVWNNPREDIPWLRGAVAAAEQGGPNLNRYTISYEFIGTPDDPAWDAQYRSAILLSRYFCAKYGISPHRGRQIRHADINSRGRSYDPGPKFNLAEIIRELGGDPANLTD